MTASSEERPPLDFMGPYNIPRSDFPDYEGESWAETDKLKRLSIREFLRVRTEIVAALSKHGKVYGESDGEHDFFVYDDKFFDRTQKVELETTDRLASIITPAVAELQRVLKKHSLWRVMFIGHGHESQAHEQFFVVYPDVVRIRQLEPGKSVDEAIVENAQIRMRHHHERKEHQIRRRGELKKAIIAAFSKLDNCTDDPSLVAWFSTVSALDWDWGWEGKPGTSVWLLVGRNLSGEAQSMQTDMELSTWWALPDGTFIRDEAEPKGARLLLHLEDSHQVRQELTITVSGKKMRLTRPSNS